MAEHTDADVELVARADFKAQWPGRDWDAIPAGEADEYRADARAVLSALSAVGRDHTAGIAEGRRLERESVVAYLREFVGHLSARDIERGRHLEGLPPANDIGATGRWRPEKSRGAPTAPPTAPVDLMAALRASIDCARTARGERTEEGHTDEP